MNIIYVTALFGIQINEKLINPLEMKNNIYISNNVEHIKPYLKTKVLRAIGEIEANILFSGSTFIYQVGHILIKDQMSSETVLFLREVQAFEIGLWLIEDCSVNNELGFGILLEEEYIHSNSLTIFNTRSDGTKNDLIIGKDKLNQAITIYKNHLGGVHDKDVPENTRFQAGLNRTGIAFSHLQTARSSDDLAIKVAHYCTFFEAILSTSTSELSHQVAERSALLLGTTKEEKIKIYKEIKNAYGVRSRIFHGERVSRKQLKDIAEVSKFTDDIARKLMNKILIDNNISNIINSSDTSVIEEYMLNLLF